MSYAKFRRLAFRYNRLIERSLRLESKIKSVKPNTKEFDMIFRDLVNARLECKETDKKIFENHINSLHNEQIRINQRTGDSLE